MAEPAHQPGWYPDPWKQAELRWHDGSDWTGQMHGTATAPHLSGADALPPMSAAGSRSTGTSGKAIASLVTALVGIPLVPIILGILALRDIGRSAGALTGRGLAIAGIVISGIGLLFIPILLAVAIPTFLAQQDVAISTMAKANAKEVVTAVETCAVVNLDGSYTGCLSAAKLSETEPSLAPMLARCGQPGGACVKAIGTQGYEVTTMVAAGSGPSSTFVERHTEQGTIEKTCSGPQCPTGTW